VEVYVGRKKRGVYEPDREAFPHLPHPPFRCTGMGGIWGGGWRDLRVVGLLGGKVAAQQRIAADGIPRQLILRADDGELSADGADMTRLTFCVADAYGNALPFVSAAVTLEASGPAGIVGENPFPLVAGVGAVYLRAARTPGRAVVTASAPRLAAQTVRVRIRPYRSRL